MALVYLLPTGSLATSLGGTDNGLFSIDSSTGVISRAGTLTAGTAYNVAYLVYDTVAKTSSGRTETITATAAVAPSPAQNWRLAIPSTVTDSTGDTTTASAVQNSSANKTHAAVPLTANQTRVLTIPTATVQAPGGLLYACTSLGLTDITNQGSNGSSASARVSSDGGSSWTAASVAQGGIQRGIAWTLPAGTNRVELTGVAGSSALTMSVGLFQRPASGRIDSWLVDGASFEDYGHHPDQWTAALKAAFSAYDPIVFNTAVLGSTTLQVKNRVVGELSSFPLVSYVVPGQTGNTVTNTRPYSTASGTEFTSMRSDLDATYAAITNAGMVGLTWGISYREYSSPNAVNNNANPENGSLPYNLNIVYPAIQAAFPDLFDASLGIPRCDDYGYFLTNRSTLLGGGDGTHPVSASAYASIRAYEVSVLGAYVYGTAFPASLQETAVAAFESGKTQALKDKATELVNSLPSSSAKTAFQNRIAAVTVVVPAPVNTAVPTITGTPQVGQTLTASQGTWNNSPTSYAYQWNRAGTAISGATSSTYVPVSADVGNALTVTVTATNSGGSASATSAATSAVTAAPTSSMAVGDVVKLHTHSNNVGSPTTATGWNALMSSGTSVGTVALNKFAGGSSGATATANGFNAGGINGAVPSPAGSGAVPDDVLLNQTYADKAGSQGNGASSQGNIVFSGLTNGTYTVQALGSRASVSRLVNFTVAGTTTPLQVGGNTANFATFTGVSVTGGTLTVSVSQNGSENFAHCNAVILTRTA